MNPSKLGVTKKTVKRVWRKERRGRGGTGREGAGTGRGGVRGVEHELDRKGAVDFLDESLRIERVAKPPRKIIK